MYESTPFVTFLQQVRLRCANEGILKFFQLLESVVLYLMVEPNLDINLRWRR